MSAAGGACGRGECLGGQRFRGRALAAKVLRELGSEAAVSGVCGAGDTGQASNRRGADGHGKAVGIDRVLQALQFTHQRTRATEVSQEQSRLEPAVEVLDATLMLRSSGWGECRLDAKAQA